MQTKYNIFIKILMGSISLGVTLTALNYIAEKTDITPKSNWSIEESTGKLWGTYVPDADLIYSRDENSDDEQIKSRQDIPDGIKIVFLGDSFTYGYGVKPAEAIPSITTQILGFKNIRAQVYNAGIPGYGTDQELIYLMRLLDNSHPEVLVWNINENDIFDNQYACLFLEANGKLIRFSGILNTLYMYSKIKKFLHSYEIAMLLAEALPDRYTLGCSAISSFDAALRKITLEIKAMQKLAQEHKFTLIVTLLESQHGYESTTEQSPQYQQKIKRMVESINSTGVTFVRPSEIIMSIPSPEFLRDYPELLQNLTSLNTYLFLNDDAGFPYGTKHMNAYGNELVSIVILEKINQLHMFNKHYRK